MNDRRFVAVLVASIAAAAHAAPIPIVNRSFEDPVLADGAFEFQTPGWVRTETFCGVFNPSVSAFPSQAPDGQNVAFLDGASVLVQRVGAILQPHTVYTMTVEYGAQLSFAGIAPLIQIRAGGAVIAESTPAPPAAAGTFQTLSLEFVTGDEHARLGQTIEIVLRATGPGVQVDYDNVRLDASPDTMAAECVTPRQILNAPGPDQGLPDQGFAGYFGYGLAVSDDTAAVFGGPNNTLHFYSIVGGAWVLSQTLPTPLTISEGPLPMAIDGDTLLVSSSLQGGTATASGTVHVFQRVGDVWTFSESIEPAASAFNDRFGAACDIQGDRIIVGATGVNTGQGNATVFRRSGAAWVLEGTLVPAGSDGNRYGTAVTIDGEFAFLGSQINTIAVFKRTGNTWTQIDWIPGPASSAFGSSLDADGGTLIVGAPNATIQNPHGDHSQGVAYLYRLFNGQWTLEQPLMDASPEFGEHFGALVRVSGGRAVVLVPDEDDFDGTFGSISVFQRGLFGWRLLTPVDVLDTDSSAPIRPIALSGRHIIMNARVGDPLIIGQPRRLVFAIDLDAPEITQQPLDQSAGVGESVVLGVRASTTQATYAWRKDGVALADGLRISGAMTDTLMIDPAEATDTGNYDCVMGSLVGCLTVVSESALVLVSGAAACPGDANMNGAVEFSDITFVLQNWGVGCP